MREILFRAKAINRDKGYHRTEYKNGDWVYGLVTRLYDERFENLPAEMTNTSGISGIEVDYKTIGQFTGLTDKNGRKIFEGDIFKFPDEIWESSYTSCGTEWDSWETENYGVVGFDEYYARFDFVQYKYNKNSVEADLHENNCLEFSRFVKELEIVGNIHDNPELLKGK